MTLLLLVQVAGISTLNPGELLINTDVGTPTPDQLHQNLQLAGSGHQSVLTVPGVILICSRVENHPSGTFPPSWLCSCGPSCVHLSCFYLGEFCNSLKVQLRDHASLRPSSIPTLSSLSLSPALSLPVCLSLHVRLPLPVD